MESKIKNSIFIFLFTVLAFPFLELNLSFYESGKLNGVIYATDNPSFSWDKWWGGSYQKLKSAYLNDSTGCRTDLVRSINQVDFWLFKKAHANGVVVGKDDYLFEQPYIDEYYGSDYSGEDTLRQVVIKLREVQDTLERLGKTCIFIYAPSKPYFFPDKLPANAAIPGTKNPTNYATFKRLCDSELINQIDFNAWFLSMKNTSKDLLFSPLGIHWTTYGSLLAADSLIKYEERVRNIQMPELQIKKINHSYIPQNADADLAEGMNLIFPLKKQYFSYPEYYYNHDGNKAMPDAIYIGDSFLWSWVSDGLMQNINKTWSFWYYFTEDWSQQTIAGNAPLKRLDDFDWQKDLLNTGCIIILYVPSSFNSFNKSKSCIQKMYEYFYPGKR